jgi:hypothetical protein
MIFPRTNYPRGHCGGPEDVAMLDTSLLIILSVDDEYTTNTLSEPRGCLLSASVGAGKWGALYGFLTGDPDTAKFPRPRPLEVYGARMRYRWSAKSK